MNGLGNSERKRLYKEAKKSKIIADDFYNQGFYRLAARIYLISKYFYENLEGKDSEQVKRLNEVIERINSHPEEELSDFVIDMINKPITKENLGDILTVLGEFYNTDENLLEEGFIPHKGWQ